MNKKMCNPTYHFLAFIVLVLQPSLSLSLSLPVSRRLYILQDIDGDYSAAVYKILSDFSSLLSQTFLYINNQACFASFWFLHLLLLFFCLICVYIYIPLHQWQLVVIFSLIVYLSKYKKKKKKKKKTF
jgi:hypothetical protein